MMNDDAIVFITQWVFSYVNAVQTTLPYDLIAVHTAKLIQIYVQRIGIKGGTMSCTVYVPGCPSVRQCSRVCTVVTVHVY